MFLKSLHLIPVHPHSECVSIIHLPNNAKIQLNMLLLYLQTPSLRIWNLGCVYSEHTEHTDGQQSVFSWTFWCLFWKESLFDAIDANPADCSRCLTDVLQPSQQVISVEYHLTGVHVLQCTMSEWRTAFFQCLSLFGIWKKTKQISTLKFFALLINVTMLGKLVTAAKINDTEV